MARCRRGGRDCAAAGEHGDLAAAVPWAHHRTERTGIRRVSRPTWGPGWRTAHTGSRNGVGARYPPAAGYTGTSPGPRLHTPAEISSSRARPGRGSLAAHGHAAGAHVNRWRLGRRSGSAAALAAQGDPALVAAGGAVPCAATRRTDGGAWMLLRAAAAGGQTGSPTGHTRAHRPADSASWRLRLSVHRPASSRRVHHRLDWSRGEVSRAPGTPPHG